MRGRKLISKKEAVELLLPKLRLIQQEQGFLSEDSLKKISLDTGIHITKIYEVATFYSFLTTEKKGRHVIRLCNSPTCYINGAKDILAILEKHLGIKAGETTADGRFTIEINSCIGCCNESPAALIDGRPYTKLNEEKIKEIIEKCR